MIKTAETGGIIMDYVVFGRGEKNLVIIPGLSIKSVTLSEKSLMSVFSEYTGEYTVYIFDRRKNSYPGYSIRDMADDTATVMKYIGIESAFIFGASQGGVIAQMLAINYPDMVKALALGSSLSKANPTAQKNFDIWNGYAAAGDIENLAESMVDTIFSQELLKSCRKMLIDIFTDVSEEELEHFKINCAALQDKFTYDELHLIKCPVLVIGSEGDKVLSAEGSREIALKLGCEIFMYGPEYSHAVYDEDPCYYDRVISFFNKYN